MGVSEARVETIDSVVRLVCRDARAAESRLGCSVIPIRDFCNWSVHDEENEERIQSNRTSSPRAADTL